MIRPSRPTAARALVLALLLTAFVTVPDAFAQAVARAPDAVATAAAPPDSRGYYRFPAVHGNTIVFVAEGDLWTVPTTGGTARRLTTHPADETHPAISPDGTTLAFSAAYEGPTEVYTMPIDGGLPVRHTYDGGGASVVGWTPDGRILYATSHYSTLPNAQLVTIDPATDRKERIPLAQAADAAFGPDGRTLYFTRLAKQPSNTRRYKGGTAENLWVFTLPERLPGLAGGATSGVFGPDGSVVFEGGLPAAPAGAPGNGAAPNRAGGPGAALPAPMVASPVQDGEAVPLTADYPGTSKAPMWWNGRIYFASDRDGVMNIWSMNPDGGNLEQLTHHADYEVQSPSLENGHIVYQDGADLWLLDLASGTDTRIDIRLTSDFDQQRENWVDQPMRYMTDVHLSPDGDRVVLTARGQVFVAPVEDGRFVRATRGRFVRYRDARFMPDGEQLLTLSDESGEVELWTLPADGVGERTQLTDDGEILRWEAVPSPDGKRIAHTDKNQRLWIYDAATKQDTRIANSMQADIGDLEWSPDSRWLAFVEVAPNQLQQIRVYSVETGDITDFTTARYDSYSPVWSPEGRWLYFLSDRHFESAVGSPWGSRQPDPYFANQTRIYALSLRDGQHSPFRPADELSDSARADRRNAGDGGDAAKSDRAGAQSSPPPTPVEIDLAGIRERLFEVPAPAGDYASLSTDGQRLYWVARRAAPRSQRIMTLEIATDGPKPVTFLEDAGSYELSLDHRKLLIHKGDSLYVVNAAAKAPEKLSEARLDLDDWTFSIDPREEWQQSFMDAWRLERDYFYDPGMHGLDWPAMREKYLPLAQRVTDRAELNDVLAQMVAELSALHIFVRGGDMREGEDDIAPASLGAVLERDEGAGGWRITHIYRGDPDLPADLAPLAKPDVDVHEGDVIVAINGTPTLSVRDAAELLRNQAEKEVRLRVRSGSAGAEARGAPPQRSSADGRGESMAERDVIVTPISQSRESDLRYDEWEYSRRVLADRLGDGRIGYVHLRAMGGADIAQWVRDYYPVFNRQGLIIDARHNRGGNIDSWILGKLMREPWMYWQPRVGDPYWNMQFAFRGPMVVLVDEHTASDGEAFAEGFRRLGLGKVIGTRTWGGEIWLSSSNVLADRGIATAAEMGVYGPEGKWLIEGWGVEPDIVVDNLPHATFGGQDAQLEAAVKLLLEAIRANPTPVPPAPAYPKKGVASGATGR